MKNVFGCETGNKWLDGVLIDRYGARVMITQKHRYNIPIYDPKLATENHGEYIKRSELYDFMRNREFKKFIDNLSLSQTLEDEAKMLEKINKNKLLVLAMELLC